MKFNKIINDHNNEQSTEVYMRPFQVVEFNLISLV